MPNNGDDSRENRLQELERLTESLARANKELLTAQVLMSDRQDRFARNLDDLVERQKRTDAQIAALLESQKDQHARSNRLDERVDRLVSAIGELIRRFPPPA